MFVSIRWNKRCERKRATMAEKRTTANPWQQVIIVKLEVADDNKKKGFTKLASNNSRDGLTK